jgi:hypothetical protein
MRYAPRMTTLAALMVLAALVVLASGCGASETTRTSSAASVATSALRSEAPHVTSQSTSSKVAPQTSVVHPPKPAQPAKPTNTAPKPQTTSPLAPAQAAKPRTTAKQKTNASAPLPAPKGFHYPSDVKHNFMVSCAAAHGSTSSCECLILKYEALQRELGVDHAMAELLATDVVLKTHLKLNRRAKQYAAECHSAIT